MIWHLTKASWGGAGRYAVRLSQALQDLGRPSTVLVSENDTQNGILELEETGRFPARVTSRLLGATLHRTSTQPFHTSFRPTAWRLPASRSKDDIFHLHGLSGWIGLGNLDRWLPAQARVFWTCHDMWPLSGGCCIHAGCDRFATDCRACPILKPPVRFLPPLELRRKARFVREHSVTLVANSHWMAERIRSSAVCPVAQPPITVVPPIVDDVFFGAKPHPASEEGRAAPTNRFTIGLSARSVTDRNKGLREFMDALSQDTGLASTATLLLAGDGRLDVPPHLDVRHLGELTLPEDMAAFYRQCDVFVSASAMETFGMSVVEAQAAGTPVAGFRVGGIPEAVSPSCQGHLVSHREFTSLLACLRSLRDDPAAAKAAGRAASGWVGSRFSSRAIAQAQAALYDS